MSQNAQKSKVNHVVTQNRASKNQSNPVKSSQNNKANVHVDINENNNQVIVDVTPQKTTVTKRINIFEAVKQKNYDDICAYVNAKGDVNVKNAEGYTPLMQAIQNGWNATEVKKMLDHMPGVDLKLYAFKSTHSDWQYGKPIDMAVKHNDIELVKVLTDYASTITPNIETDDFYTLVNFKYEIYKVLLSHLDAKAFTIDWANYAVSHILACKETDAAQLIDSILSKTDTYPERLQVQLLKNAQKHHRNEEALDLIIRKKYVGNDAISHVLLEHMENDNEPMFREIICKIENKQQVVDNLDKWIFQKSTDLGPYKKYADLLGIKYQDDAGTIFISEVIDIPGNKDLNFDNKNSINSDIHTCQGGQCFHISVSAAEQPSLANVIDDIVV
ncbi:MAG: ankyrin repeat domain-containing protein [Candidatus Berkiella sp.]